MQLPAGPAALAAPLLALPVAFGVSAVTSLDVRGVLLRVGRGFADRAGGGRDHLGHHGALRAGGRSPPAHGSRAPHLLLGRHRALRAEPGHGRGRGAQEELPGAGSLLAGLDADERRGFPAGQPDREIQPELSPSFLLNLPYLLLLTWAGLRLFQQPRALPSLSPEKIAEEQRKPLYRRPQDLLLILILILTAAFTFFRGMVVLDCPADSCFDYTYLHEPYLRDAVGYPKVQMLIYLFYLLPFLLLAIYGLALPGCSWLPDWSLVFAGGVAQAQFAHVGSSLHSRTPFPYQTPEEVLWSFLLSNALYALGPQLLALRCLRSPAFFLRPAAPGPARAKKYQ
ncbi:transmembrane 6 superfamily member 2 [Anomalospiza imberbis]|uniref:transmembrane 6 superfamily member 2 n=1 Tax=Anomalospiza imberbis TaxID=187417 RepID=UPI0035900574